MQLIHINIGCFNKQPIQTHRDEIVTGGAAAGAEALLGSEAESVELTGGGGADAFTLTEEGGGTGAPYCALLVLTGGGGLGGP
jgi:hypothetical protein